MRQAHYFNETKEKKEMRQRNLHHEHEHGRKETPYFGRHSVRQPKTQELPLANKKRGFSNARA